MNINFSKLLIIAIVFFITISIWSVYKTHYLSSSSLSNVPNENIQNNSLISVNTPNIKKEDIPPDLQKAITTIIEAGTQLITDNREEVLSNTRATKLDLPQTNEQEEPALITRQTTELLGGDVPYPKPSRTKYKIIDLSGKDTPLTNHVLAQKYPTLYSGDIGLNGSPLIQYEQSYVGERRIAVGSKKEIWVTYYDRSSEEPIPFYIFDKFVIEQPPKGFIFTSLCSQRFHENTEIKAVAKLHNDMPNANERAPLTAHHRRSDEILKAWVFNPETLKYSLMDNTEGIECTAVDPFS